MFLAIAAVAFVTLSRAISAPPLAHSASAVKPMSPGVTLGVHVPLHELGGLHSAVAHQNITLGADGVHAKSTDDIYPATLVLCSDTSCQECFGYDLITLPRNQCLSGQPSAINSVGIIKPSNEGLPFAVIVGPDCSRFAQIAAVNTCYGINGGPFAVFAVLQQ